MRTLIILVGLLLMAAGSAAQVKVDLTPIRMVINGDTLQCFTHVQAQEIAKRITQLQYRNADVVDLEAIISKQECMLEDKDAVILAGFQKVNLVEEKLAGRQVILAKQEELIRHQAAQLRQGEEQIRRLRLKGRVMSTLGTIVIITLGILTAAN